MYSHVNTLQCKQKNRFGIQSLDANPFDLSARFSAFRNVEGGKAVQRTIFYFGRLYLVGSDSHLAMTTVSEQMSDALRWKFSIRLYHSHW